jgi:hypothetical protein
VLNLCTFEVNSYMLMQILCKFYLDFMQCLYRFMQFLCTILCAEFMQFCVFLFMDIMLCILLYLCLLCHFYAILCMFYATFKLRIFLCSLIGSINCIIMQFMQFMHLVLC